MGLSSADATALGAICTMVALIAQGFLNQWGAERARKHELELRRLELEEEHEREREEK